MTIELFLDTSTDKGLMALWKGGVMVEERPLQAGPFSSSSLFPSLHTFLCDHRLRLHDIGCFSAGTGPGSFTGLRVAMSIQQTWAYSGHRRLGGIGSLCLWTPFEPGSFVAMVDARSGGIYCQAAYWDPGCYQILTPAMRLSVDDALQLAERYGQRIATPTAAPLRVKLPSCFRIEESNPSTQRSFPFVPRDSSPRLQYGSTIVPKCTATLAACTATHP